ncbi:hypothetical protein L2E82_16494 [Cichorium intybus]|uniref:Uncharacterized protein n=1 Tax=Cichorium intybus TaxID=13427 RepID=A0ACB9F6Y3_CICIN|nr:hypothetical protein L2E82_16494 [Cichorium intybus]
MHAMSATMNGALYNFGGIGSHTVESFSPKNNQWVPRPPLYWKSIQVPGDSINDNLFAIGGCKGCQISSDVEYLDLKIGKWLPIHSMNDKYLEETYDTHDTQDDIKLLRSQKMIYTMGLQMLFLFHLDEAGKHVLIVALVANVEGMIKSDRKITSLKQLQVSMNKKETKSYVEMSESLGVHKLSDILFVTYVFQEAVAAKAAGVVVIIYVRPGNG